ncbi:MAG: DUF222 domain-containing protein, partial [Gemmatimonadetes bacterium]|nr:DUF222 domain-containing protein [Gemmatimonadota bacterium]
LGPAREKVRVARCLPSLPLISGALAKGEISYSKVRALTRVASADSEAELLTFARHGTTAHVERLVREWRRLDRGDACQAARAERRGLSLHLADDGSYEVRGRLSPEVGSLLLKALEVAEDKLYRAERAAGTEDRTTAAQRRADALGLWLEERVQPRVQLVVHSLEGDAAQKREAQQSQEAPQKQEAPAGAAPASLVTASLVTEDGSNVSAETSSRLACDADVVRITRAGDGSVLDVGRRQRSVGWRLRRALDARDGGCRFPGCGSRLRTHAHHITHWAHGGETAMNNLVLLCPFHHRAVHEGGWRVEMDARGVPRFFNPLGVPVPVVPAPPDIGGLLPQGASAGSAADLSASLPADRSGSLPADASARSPQDFGLARWHGHPGIGAHTAMSRWRGERPRLGLDSGVSLAGRG